MDDVGGQTMIEVLREGEPTLDGRFICYGAIELPDVAVPLFDYDHNDRDANKIFPIGVLHSFVRGDNNRIYCETDVDDKRMITVTVAIDEREVVAGEDIGILKARIIGGVIGEEMRYPWPPDK